MCFTIYGVEDKMSDSNNDKDKQPQADESSEQDGRDPWKDVQKSLDIDEPRDPWKDIKENKEINDE